MAFQSKMLQPRTLLMAALTISGVHAFAPVRPRARAAPLSAQLSADRESLRTLRVKELQSELGLRNIRWQTFLEKEELVVALSLALEAEAGFSESGALSPGVVGDISAADFEVEAGGDGPLLLDIYATWCGPCQMMAPELARAAEELGADCRVCKLDSDKYPQLASALRCGGLPTLVLFRGGAEVDRVEGALSAAQLVAFARGGLARAPPAAPPAAAAAALDAAIAAPGAVVFATASCPFCAEARALLDSKGATYALVDLDARPDGAELRAALGTRVGRTSVPAVFIGGEYVGGMNDGAPGLRPLDAAGGLDAKLQAAGAL